MTPFLITLVYLLTGAAMVGWLIVVGHRHLAGPGPSPRSLTVAIALWPLVVLIAIWLTVSAVERARKGAR